MAQTLLCQQLCSPPAESCHDHPAPDRLGDPLVLSACGANKHPSEARRHLKPKTCVTGNDGALVWAAGQGGCQAFLQGHDAATRWAALGSDGSTLLTASADGMIKKWDLRAGACLRTFQGAAGPACLVCMALERVLSSPFKKNLLLRTDGSCG